MAKPMIESARSAPVPGKPAKRADSSVDPRWSWAESAAWTPRMLAALERGVKGGRWHSLVDKVYSQKVLRRAYAQVKRNRGAAGVDRQSIAMYEAELDHNLAGMEAQLRSGSYRPMPVRRVYIPKASGGRRPLGIPAVRDRIVQTALRMVLEPIFERDFADTSFGFRPRRSAHGALRRLEELLAQGHTHVVDVDIRSYFDTIPHDALLTQVKDKIADGKVLSLLRSFLTQGVMEDGVGVWKPTTGTPQGATISPLLSNLYLDPLDHLLRAQGFEAIRYADDLVILCRDKAQAHSALTLLQSWTASAGLELHPEKTRIVDATRDAFEFLGYRFDPKWRRPRQSSLAKFKDALRSRTRRANGQSLDAIIQRINPIIRGWASYFRFCSRWVFETLDKWIRMRLRSILRKRRGLRGRGRGVDHQRWPNAFFAEHGLLSLVAAHAPSCPVRSSETH